MGAHISTEDIESLHPVNWWRQNKEEHGVELREKYSKPDSIHLSELEAGESIAIFGRRGSRRADVVRNILYSNRDIPIGLAILQDGDPNNFRKHIPAALIKEGSETFECLNAIKSLNTHQQKVKEEHDHDERAFLLRNDQRIFTSNEYDQLVNDCYDSNLLFIQEFYYPTTTLRLDMFNFLVMFRYTLEYSTKQLYDSIAKPHFNTYAEFKDIMDKLSADECLVIDTNQDGGVFVYNVKEPVANFKIGHPDLWEPEIWTESAARTESVKT